MCGRVVQVSDPIRLSIVEGLNVRDTRLSNYPRRWNAAPSQELLVIRENHKTGERSLDLLKWGLIPYWCKDPSGGRKPINAKSETVATLPTFRDAYQRRRCILPVDAFYEWRATKGRKQPYAIAMKDRSPFGIACIWENWKNPKGEWARTFAILTTPANELIATIHDRMPAILAPGDYGHWLGAEPDPHDLLEPFPSEPMTHPFYTIGHSTRPVEEFVELLTNVGITFLADVRTVPRSRTNPQYNRDVLPDALAAAQIEYEHIPTLGGLRGRQPDVPPSTNAFWQNESFHNYADYAMGDAFHSGLAHLLECGKSQVCAILCAEAVWWRCHRRIIADYLLAAGETVFHILGSGKIEPARMTDAARRHSSAILTYPIRNQSINGSL